MSLAGRAVLVVVRSSLAACAVAPAVASAQCPSGAQCGRADRRRSTTRGRRAGTLPLAYAKRPGHGHAHRHARAARAAGPARRRSRSRRRSPSCSRPLRASYDIVTVDQRGTGDSGRGRVRRRRARDASCAERLGDRRAFFNTPETAHDLEDLRVALGVDEAHAARRLLRGQGGGRVRAPLPGVDGRAGARLAGAGRRARRLDQLRTLGAPRVLREVCFPGLCHARCTDPDEALAAAAGGCRTAPCAGRWSRRSGRVRTERVRERDLYTVLARQRPSARGCAPACRRRSPRWPPATPRRCCTWSRSLPAGDGDAGEINSARLLATACIEARLPWAPDSPVAVARRRAAGVRRRADATSFAPFCAETVLGALDRRACARPGRRRPRPERVAVRRPGRPGARALRPRRPAHAAGGRAPHRAAVPERQGARRARRRPLGAVHRRSPAAPSTAWSRSCAAARSRQCSREQRVARRAAPYAPATLGGLRPTRLPGVARAHAQRRRASR